jgi:hypothetical protein
MTVRSLTAARLCQENMLFRAITSLLALVMLAMLAGCQKADEDTSTDVDEFVDASIAPNPATASESTDGKTYRVVRGNNQPDDIYAYKWKTHVTTSVTLNSHATDSDGADLEFPVTLNSATVKVQQASGGVVNPPTGGETEHYESTITSASGNSFGAVNSTVTTAFDIWYTLPSGNKEALISVTLAFTDDNGKTFSKVVDVNVAP